MADQAKIWDRFAKRYSERKISNTEAFEQKLADTQAYLKPDDHVFEFGCGTGTIALAHSPYVKHILATDISENMLDIAKQRAQQKGCENVTFEKGRIEDYAQKMHQFDAVMAHSILHLLDNRMDTISHAYNSLKPGGVFISSTICLKDIPIWVKVILSLGRFLGLLPNIKFLQDQTIIEEIKQAGFTIEQSRHPKVKEGLFIIAKKP